MITIFVSFTAKPGKEAQFQKELVAQAGRCLANEPGCRQWDVSVDAKNPARFALYEVYDNDAALKAHTESQHYKDFRPLVADLLADRKVEIFGMVSDGKTKR